MGKQQTSVTFHFGKTYCVYAALIPTLLRNPCNTWRAFTVRERGMRIVLSRITARQTQEQQSIIVCVQFLVNIRKGKRKRGIRRTTTKTENVSYTWNRNGDNSGSTSGNSGSTSSSNNNCYYYNYSEFIYYLNNKIFNSTKVPKYLLACINEKRKGKLVH